MSRVYKREPINYLFHPNSDVLFPSPKLNLCPYISIPCCTSYTLVSTFLSKGSHQF